MPELQDLRVVGDRIVTIPGMGPTLRAMERDRLLLFGDDVVGTWCMALEATGDRACRLVSRWRQHWKLTPASALWIAISDPVAFVMERKMLQNIKCRAETRRAGRPASDTPITGGV